MNNSAIEESTLGGVRGHQNPCCPCPEILRDIKNNLSLRKPQARSLEILAKVAAVVPMKKNGGHGVPAPPSAAAGALGDRALPSSFGRAVAPRPPNFDASAISARYASR